MIRSVTIATFLMACGSGLYLYQSKHEVQVLDHTIEHTVHETAAVREQTRLLATEWTMLNDPERLQQFAAKYLTLKPIDPKQFTSLADLDSKLPPPVVPTPEGSDQDPASAASAADGPSAENAGPAPAVTPVVAEDGAVAVESWTPDTSADTAPVPRALLHPNSTLAAARPVEHAVEHKLPMPHSPEVQTARAPSLPLVRAADARQVVVPRPPHVVEVRSAQLRPADIRNAEIRSPEFRGLALRPPVQTALVVPPVASAPVHSVSSQSSLHSGSLLGMAHAASTAPQPVPVNATFNAN